MERKLCAVILAGGEGKRMKSNRPKVLSKVLFRPMISWVIDTVKAAGAEDICVVTGSGSEYVKEYLATLSNPTETAFQAERLGTGHAVMMAGDFIASHSDCDVLIANGDAPFIGEDTIRSALKAHQSTEDIMCTVIAAEVEDPKGYGRIVRDAENLLGAIVEEKEASDEIRKIKEVNSGAYIFDSSALTDALSKLTKSSITGEYYLTDTVEIIKKSGGKTAAFKADNADSVLGANDCIQLSQLNEIARKRVLEHHMKNGVNIPCIDGVIIGRDVEIGANTTILPASVIRGKTVIGSLCELGPAVFIEDCTISEGTILNNVTVTKAYI